MAGTFGSRTRQLGEMVGDGDLEGKIEVDQVNALALHSGFWRTGPLAGVTNRPRHGGRMHFLSGPLMEDSARYFQKLADDALEPGGLVGAMRENVEGLSREVYDNAHRVTNALRNSAHPTVVDNGRLVYDRPPVVPRLTSEEYRRRSEAAE